MDDFELPEEYVEKVDIIDPRFRRGEGRTIASNIEILIVPRRTFFERLRYEAVNTGQDFDYEGLLQEPVRSLSEGHEIRRKDGSALTVQRILPMGDTVQQLELMKKQ